MAKEIFKNFSEVEDFFKNLGIEYRFSCYHENNAEGCHLLGNYMTAIQNDYVRAAKVFKENCDNNNYPRSCTEYGNSRMFGHGVEKDFDIGVNYYSKACELNDPHGCFSVGQLLIGSDPNYKEIKPDIKKALNYLEKGCGLWCKDRMFAGECCYAASSLYLHGKYGCEKNLEKAFELASKGCENEIIPACQNLSLMYLRGVGTEQNVERGNHYRAKVLDYMQQYRSNKSLEFGRTS